MCVSAGAPKKPSYGPCNEHHGNPSAPMTTAAYCYQYYYPAGTSASAGIYLTSVNTAAATITLWP